ncbi:MAG TPA: DUF3108 domain-containing protein [Gemmatimonadaceae bacterium]|nr:DUF3108 domain-containing protein [Gemmatimonadaceae bacterium]
MTALRRVIRLNRRLLPSALALGVVVALAATSLGGARAATAQSLAPSRPALDGVAFALGESMVYDVKYGMFNVGTARMEVVGIDTVRGRPAYHTRLEIRGGIPGYRVHDVLESWIDVATFSSLRYRQETSEGKRQRTRVFEIMPERGVFVEDSKPARPTVAQPLDDGAFIYFVRNQPLELGRTYSYDRYFIPDRNPVTVIAARRERITVPAGAFDALVVKPVIKSKGIFSKNGRAEIWFTDDDRRLMVRMETHVVFGTISLQLREFSQGSTP